MALFFGVVMGGAIQASEDSPSTPERAVISLEHDRAEFETTLNKYRSKLSSLLGEKSPLKNFPDHRVHVNTSNPFAGIRELASYKRGINTACIALLGSRYVDGNLNENLEALVQAVEQADKESKALVAEITSFSTATTGRATQPKRRSAETIFEFRSRLQNDKAEVKERLCAQIMWCYTNLEQPADRSMYELNLSDLWMLCKKVAAQVRRSAAPTVETSEQYFGSIKRLYNELVDLKQRLSISTPSHKYITFYWPEDEQEPATGVWGYVPSWLLTQRKAIELPEQESYSAAYRRLTDEIQTLRQQYASQLPQQMNGAGMASGAARGVVDEVPQPPVDEQHEEEPALQEPVTVSSQLLGQVANTDMAYGAANGVVDEVAQPPVDEQHEEEPAHQEPGTASSQPLGQVADTGHQEIPGAPVSAHHFIDDSMLAGDSLITSEKSSKLSQLTTGALIFLMLASGGYGLAQSLRSKERRYLAGVVIKKIFGKKIPPLTADQQEEVARLERNLGISLGGVGLGIAGFGVKAGVNRYRAAKARRAE